MQKSLREEFAAQSRRMDGLADAMLVVVGALTRDPPLPIPRAEACGAASALLPPPASFTDTSVWISLLLPNGDVLLRRFELDEDASHVQAWAATCSPDHFGHRFELQLVVDGDEREGAARVLRCARGESLQTLGQQRDIAVRLLYLEG